MTGIETSESGASITLLKQLGYPLFETNEKRRTHAF